MEVETLRDILHWTRELHQYLADCIKRGATRNEDQRAKLLLDYLADHERKLAHTLERFEETASPKALDSWVYEYLDRTPITRLPASDRSFSAAGAREAMAEVIELHEQVLSLYHYLQGRAETASTRELLDELTDLEQHQTMQMVHNANRFEDL